jgi:hypothetical protein
MLLEMQVQHQKILHVVKCGQATMVATVVEIQEQVSNRRCHVEQALEGIVIHTLKSLNLTHAVSVQSVSAEGAFPFFTAFSHYLPLQLVSAEGGQGTQRAVNRDVFDVQHVVERCSKVRLHQTRVQLPPRYMRTNEANTNGFYTDTSKKLSAADSYFSLSRYISPEKHESCDDRTSFSLVLAPFDSEEAGCPHRYF